MGTVFQHLPKISEETIYSITLKSNKISKMKVFVLCCALFFIGCVNGAPWGSETSVMKRSDALRNDHHHHGHHEQREGNLVQEDIGQEHLASRAGAQEREVVDRIIPRFESDESRQVIAKRDDEPRQIGNEPKENAGDSKAKKSAAENSEDVKALPALNRYYGY